MSKRRGEFPFNRLIFTHTRPCHMYETLLNAIGQEKSIEHKQVFEVVASKEQLSSLKDAGDCKIQPKL